MRYFKCFQVSCGLFNFAVSLQGFFFFFSSHILAQFYLLEFNSLVIDFLNVFLTLQKCACAQVHQLLFKSNDYLQTLPFHLSFNTCCRSSHLAYLEDLLLLPPPSHVCIQHSIFGNSYPIVLLLVFL